MAVIATRRSRHLGLAERVLEYAGTPSSQLSQLSGIAWQCGESKNRTLAKDARMRHPKFKNTRKSFRASEIEDLRTAKQPENLVDVTGVEPATSSMPWMRSPN